MKLPGALPAPVIVCKLESAMRILLLILFSGLLSGIFLGALPHKAAAQDYFFADDEDQQEEKEPVFYQYSSKYKKRPMPDPDKVSLLPPGQFSMYFVRTPQAAENEATLRLSATASVNGCAIMIPPEVEMRKQGRMIWVKVKDIEIDVDRSVQYAHYQCKQSGNVSATDIILNRDDLIRRKVQQIVFQSPASTDFFDVEVDKNHIALVPKNARSFKAFKVPGKIDPLNYSFLPDNVVVLSVPSPNGQTHFEKIKALAQKQGLIDARSALPGFKIEDQPNRYYFVDEARRFVDALEQGENLPFDKIVVNDTYRGAEGPYGQSKELEVYIRKPGPLE